ncbi:MAG: tRNA (guanosine(37)-N1)-methyltransferase TrmD [Candidatus Amesbacteria bacterium]|nr:tRNA (guanosine(37)-N1)-methyltransferase TrmD [Candidatus Amesbacteria bacterium]
MQIDILTLFPPMFTGPFDYSIVKRAVDKKILDLRITDLREFATDKYKSVDDKPYGGGAGMIMRIDIIDRALAGRTGKVILLDAGGEKFTQKKAIQFSKEKSLIIICGHYEGVDHRVHEHLADEIISVGDYVLSGGEIPAMILVDSITRLLPGALGNEKSLDEESHNSEDVEYPQYTRPEEYNGWKVPEVLLSGDHAKIKKWRSL